MRISDDIVNKRLLLPTQLNAFMTRQLYKMLLVEWRLWCTLSTRESYYVYTAYYHHSINLQLKAQRQ